MTVGVVVMDYGTPASRADIVRYYTHIRHGHPPTADQLADLTERYDAIGGTFPLRAISARQRDGIARALGPDYVVVEGHKHSDPSIEDAVTAVIDAGVDSVVGLVLAPHYSGASIAQYEARFAATCASLPHHIIRSWHLLPAYLNHQAQAVRSGLTQLPSGSEVILTAHSVPRSSVRPEDPYPTQLRESAAAIAARAGVTRWRTAWQSAGRTQDTWLGPDVGEVLTSLASTAPGVLVSACGFVADHLEVAYDLDIELAQLAATLRLPFGRAASINDDPWVMRALAAEVENATQLLDRDPSIF